MAEVYRAAPVTRWTSINFIAIITGNKPSVFSANRWRMTVHAHRREPVKKSRFTAVNTKYCSQWKTKTLHTFIRIHYFHEASHRQMPN